MHARGEPTNLGRGDVRPTALERDRGGTPSSRGGTDVSNGASVRTCSALLPDNIFGVDGEQTARYRVFRYYYGQGGPVAQHHLALLPRFGDDNLQLPGLGGDHEPEALRAGEEVHTPFGQEFLGIHHVHGHHELRHAAFAVGRPVGYPDARGRLEGGRLPVEAQHAASGERAHDQGQALGGLLHVQDQPGVLLAQTGQLHDTAVEVHHWFAVDAVNFATGKDLSRGLGEWLSWSG